MKKIKLIGAIALVLTTVIVSCGFTDKTVSEKPNVISGAECQIDQQINMFISHGHCSTPFSGKIKSLKLTPSIREDQGNPLENMALEFEVDPNTFNACRGEDLTTRIKTRGVFIGDKNENITFRSTHVYTMGLDWYQINGIMSIKGVEKEVQLFASGIRDPKESNSTLLIVDGKMDLFDWGIDYDKLVNGKSDSIPTRLFYLNMKIEI